LTPKTSSPTVNSVTPGPAVDGEAALLYLVLARLVYLGLVYFFPQGIAGLWTRLAPAQVAAMGAAVPRPGLGEIEGEAAVAPDAGAPPGSPAPEATPLETRQQG